MREGVFGGEMVQAVAPGERLAVRMTPPRAGTFIYHVHPEPGHQLAKGLYFMQISLDENKGLRLPDPDGEPVLWTPEVSGDHLLEITTEYDAGLPAFPREAPPDHRMQATFRVRR